MEISALLCRLVRILEFITKKIERWCFSVSNTGIHRYTCKKQDMTTEVLSVASFIVMFIVMCTVIKIYFAVKNMQPVGDQRAVIDEIRAGQRAVVDIQPRAQTVVGHAVQPRTWCHRRVMGAEQRGDGNHGARPARPRPQENDERFCWKTVREWFNVYCFHNQVRHRR